MDNYSEKVYGFSEFDKQVAMQLFEKCVLSKYSLLDTCGFNIEYYDGMEEKCNKIKKCSDSKKQIAIQLFEKGVLSVDVLLDTCGYSADFEAKQKIKEDMPPIN